MKKIFLLLVCSNIFHLGYMNGSSDKDSAPKDQSSMSSAPKDQSSMSIVFLKGSDDIGLLITLRGNGPNMFDKGQFKDVLKNIHPELPSKLQTPDLRSKGKLVKFIAFTTTDQTKTSAFTHYSFKKFQDAFIRNEWLLKTRT